MKAFLLSFLIALTQFAFADEYYEFYRLHCNEKIQSFEIDRVGYYNIMNTVWPDESEPGLWERHISSLKELEKEHDIYVFDKWYGYYSEPSIEFTCGSLHATINYDKWLREEGSIGSKEPVRMNSKLTVKSANNSIVESLSLKQIKHLQIYLDSGGSTEYIYLCTDIGCKDNLFSNVGTLNNQNIGKVIQ